MSLHGPVQSSKSELHERSVLAGLYEKSESSSRSTQVAGSFAYDK